MCVGEDLVATDVGYVSWCCRCSLTPPGEDFPSDHNFIISLWKKKANDRFIQNRMFFSFYFYDTLFLWARGGVSVEMLSCWKFVLKWFWCEDWVRVIKKKDSCRVAVKSLKRLHYIFIFLFQLLLSTWSCVEFLEVFGKFHPQTLPSTHDSGHDRLQAKFKTCSSWFS